MSRLLSDLETVLEGMIVEHRKLLAHVQSHEAAVRSFDLKAMETLARQQETDRTRIAAWELKRKAVLAQLARSARIDPGISIAQLADLFPQQRPALLKLRDELKGLAQQISNHTRISGRVAGAVLGHLNTAVRLLAGAVERAGLYTKQGIPQVSRRIGVMEAVG